MLKRLVFMFVLLSEWMFLGCSIKEKWNPETLPRNNDGSAFPLSLSEYVVSTNTNDVPDYLCDGVRDQVEINLAILAASKDAVKRTVLLKAGTYTVDSSVLFYNNVLLKGEGTDRTVIRLKNSAPSFADNAGIIRIRSKSGRITNAGIEDFTIDGNEANQEAYDEKKYGIYAEGNNIIMRRIVAKNCAGYGFDPHSAKSHTVPASNLVIEFCVSENNRTDGFTLDMVQHSIINSNIARNNGRHGFNLCTTAAYNTLTGNQSVSNGTNGMTIQNGSHSLIFNRNGIVGNREAGMVVRSSHDCKLERNNISFNGRYALDVRGILRLKILNNFMTNNGTEKPSKYGFIYIQNYNSSPSLSNVIAFNQFFTVSNVRAAVEEQPGSDDNRVCTNTVNGFANPFILYGTKTECSDNFITND